jgi:hypothetical protein
MRHCLAHTADRDGERPGRAVGLRGYPFLSPTSVDQRPLVALGAGTMWPDVALHVDSRDPSLAGIDSDLVRSGVRGRTRTEEVADEVDEGLEDLKLAAEINHPCDSKDDGPG